MAFQHEPLRAQVLDRLEYLSGRTTSTEAKLWFVQLVEAAQSAGYSVPPVADARAKESLTQLQQNMKARDRYVFWSEGSRGYYSQDERLTALMFRVMLRKGMMEEYYPHMVRYLTQSQRQYMSSSTAYRTLDALRRYTARYPSPETALNYTIDVGEIPTTGQLKTAQDIATHTTDVPPQTLVPVRMTPADEGSYYTEVELKETFRADDIRPVQKGFWVERDYFSVDDIDRQTPLHSFVAGKNYVVRLRFVTNTNHRQVMLKDPLLGGFELMHFQLDNADESLRTQATDTNATGCYGWCRPQWDHIEYDQDEIRFAADWVSAGTHEVTYVAKARIPGVYDALSTEVFEMYNPEVFATSQGQRLDITRE